MRLDVEGKGAEGEGLSEFSFVVTVERRDPRWDIRIYRIWPEAKYICISLYFGGSLY